MFFSVVKDKWTVNIIVVIPYQPINDWKITVCSLEKNDCETVKRKH